MEKVFTADDKAMAVYSWLDNLKALGEVINLITLYNPRSFEDVGEALGNIVSDYSKAVYDTLASTGKDLEGFFEDEGKGASAKVEGQAKAPGKDQD